MTSTKTKRGGLLLPNSSSLFPLVKSVNKSLPTPENIFIKDASSGTIKSNKGAFYNNYATLASRVNNNGKKIGYHKLFPSSTAASQSTTGGGKKKKEKMEKKTKKGK